MDSAPIVAAGIATAVERILKAYKNFLEVKKLRRELAEKGVPDENIKGIDQHISESMGAALDEISKEEFESHCVVEDKGRRNELKIEFRLGLNKLANRIDRGYNFEVRASKEASDSDESPDETNRHLERIRDASEGLEFVNDTGEAILSLPEKAKKKRKNS